MSRTLLRSFVALLVLLAVACGGTTPEQQLLTNFFRASRVRDNAPLSNIAAAQFNPRTDGTVQDFAIIETAPEQRRSLQIQQAMSDVEQAKAAEGEFTKRKKAYQDANMPALLRVSQNQRDKKAPTGKDA